MSGDKMPGFLVQGDAPVRMAMIGGGSGSLIGPVHRRAAALDGMIRLCAGAFSSDPERNAATGRELGLPEDRVYGSYEVMLREEARRPAAERIEFVAIVAPNHLHAPAAIAALDHGFPVLCEKPLARDLGEARALLERSRASGLLFGMTYTYLGYPLVHEARALVAAGAIGEIRRVQASYTQGWLAQREEADGNAQAAWRTDPARAGIGGALGDIGADRVDRQAGHELGQVLGVDADVRTAVPGRMLDDDGAMLLRFANGARGTLTASQVCAGDENRLTLSVYGETGSLHWEQENPNRLWHRSNDAPARMITANPGLMTAADARAMMRLPGGHPEGYIEAFANLYRAFAQQLRGHDALALPDAAAGTRSMAFVEAALASSRADSAWHTLSA
jgi:predicted dehydrogenase